MAIAIALCISRVTVEQVRRRLVKEGMERALSLYRLQQSRHYPCRMYGQAEARLIAIACLAPSDRHARWTLSFMASRLVELKQLALVSRETVRKSLKNALRPYLKKL